MVKASPVSFYSEPALLCSLCVSGYCIHDLERERNTQKHGDKPRSTVTMYKIIDMILRNRLLSSINSKKKFSSHDR